MALIKQWTTETIPGLPQGWSPDYRYRALARSTAPWAGATLLHTKAMGQISVFVPSTGTPPPAQWWHQSYVEIRFFWTPDGTVPLLDPQTEIPGDLGRIQLAHTYVGGAIGTVPNVVTYTQPECFSSTAMRRGVAGQTPAVFAALFAGDPTGAFLATANTDIWVSGFCRGLWGH